MAIIKQFFEYLFGLHLYELLRGKKKIVILLYLFVLCFVFTISWIVPISTKVVHKINNITRHYDDRFPEIHIFTGRAEYRHATIPTQIDLPNGNTVIFDTTGTYTSLEDFADGSILFTDKTILWKEDSKTEVYHLKDIKTVQPLVISPQNIATLKNMVIFWGIAIGTIIMCFIFTCLLFCFVALGSGFCVLLNSLRNGPLHPGDALTLAVFALTPFILFTSAIYILNFSMRGLWGFLIVFYFIVLAVNVILLEKESSTASQ